MHHGPDYAFAAVMWVTDTLDRRLANYSAAAVVSLQSPNKTISSIDCKLSPLYCIVWMKSGLNYPHPLAFTGAATDTLADVLPFDARVTVVHALTVSPPEIVLLLAKVDADDVSSLVLWEGSGRFAVGITPPRLMSHSLNQVSPHPSVWHWVALSVVSGCVSGKRGSVVRRGAVHAIAGQWEPSSNRH